MASVLERLMVKRTITASGCWEWGGCRTKAGYGQIKIGGRTGRVRYTHIVAYEEMVGPVPEGKVLDHEVCDNPPCLNPHHLRPTTHRVNILRGTGTSAKNAAKTHCDSGHELSGENLYVYPGGRQRACRKCMRRWDREGRERRARQHAGLPRPGH